MIIHIWMHWFWITTVYFKGFLFLAGQTISFSCISFPHFAEAGLRENETSAPVIPDLYVGGNNSSQFGNEPNATAAVVLTEGGDHPPPRQPSSPQEETNTEEPTTPRSQDDARAALGSTSDVEDIYTGGTLDVFQYPLKKFTKYSHLKYGKVKAKGKSSEEAGAEDRKVESVKLVEEKLNINISITDGRSEPEVDKTSDRPSEGATSELPTSDAPDLITTTLHAAQSGTSEEGPPGNETVDGSTPRDGGTNSTETDSSVAEVPPPPAPTEDQKETEVLKNETLVIESKVEENGGAYTTVEPFAVRNRVAAATSAQNYDAGQTDLNAGSITGITLGILVVFSLFGAVSFVLYRRRYLNKPQVFHDKCSNLDSSGYIDETSLRENSEEMYSLDNDSFLNSLEAMTIQNYWTENVKHTKL